MSAIKLLCVDTIELAHSLREVAFSRFNEDMVMIIHQAPSMTPPVETRAGLRKNIKPNHSIFIILVGIFAMIAASSHMIKRSSVFYSTVLPWVNSSVSGLQDLPRAFYERDNSGQPNAHYLFLYISAAIWSIIDA